MVIQDVVNCMFQERGIFSQLVEINHADTLYVFKELLVFAFEVTAKDNMFMQESFINSKQS